MSGHNEPIRTDHVEAPPHAARPARTTDVVARGPHGVNAIHSPDESRTRGGKR
jgi:hypothetical protein